MYTCTVHDKAIVYTCTILHDRCIPNVGVGVRVDVGPVEFLLESAYDFLFNFNRNYASILYRFRVIAHFLSKAATFNTPHLHLSPL